MNTYYYFLATALLPTFSLSIAIFIDIIRPNKSLKDIWLTEILLFPRYKEFFEISFSLTCIAFIITIQYTYKYFQRFFKRNMGLFKSNMVISEIFASGFLLSFIGLFSSNFSIKKTVNLLFFHIFISFGIIYQIHFDIFYFLIHRKIPISFYAFYISILISSLLFAYSKSLQITTYISFYSIFLKFCLTGFITKRNKPTVT